MRTKEFVFFLSAMMMLTGCKKDKLKGDKQIFIGEWQWSYSYFEDNKCNACCVGYDTIVSANYETQYSLKFFDNGKLRMYENDIRTQTYRIIFDDFVQQSNSSYIFDIHLNGHEENVLHGRVNSDSLYTWDYPFKSDDQSCYTRQSFFIKQ